MRLSLLFQLLVVALCSVIMSDDLSSAQVKRAEFVLLTLKVLHFWVSVRLHIISTPLWIQCKAGQEPIKVERDGEGEREERGGAGGRQTELGEVRGREGER